MSFLSRRLLGQQLFGIGPTRVGPIAWLVEYPVSTYNVLPFHLFVIFLYPFVGVDNGQHATEQETRHWGCQFGQHATILRVS
jgi:hypothetical protein